jgi:hypothetical protein
MRSTEKGKRERKANYSSPLPPQVVHVRILLTGLVLEL